MPSLFRIALHRCQVVLFLAMASGVQAQALTAPPIRHFFERPALGDAILSPNGKLLALRVGAQGKRDRLAVYKLADESMRIVAEFHDADVGNVQWVNDSRLVFDTTDTQLPPAERTLAPGLYAVNHDGANLRQLAEHHGGGGIREVTGRLGSGNGLLPWHTYLMDQPGAQKSDSIYVLSIVYKRRFEVEHVNLLLLNTVTGASSTVRRPPHVISWVLDHQGEARLSTTLDGERMTVQYRDPASAQWKELAAFSAYTPSTTAFEPLAIGPDGTVYVGTHAGKDTSAVHSLDLASGKISAEPLIVTTGYDFRAPRKTVASGRSRGREADPYEGTVSIGNCEFASRSRFFEVRFNGELIFSADKLLGLRVQTDALADVWLDEGMKALQKTLDSALPRTINLISLASRPSSTGRG